MNARDAEGRPKGFLRVRGNLLSSPVLLLFETKLKNSDARDMLNKLKWHEDMDLSRSMIFYVHRGAPMDEKAISGEEILELGTSFFHTVEAAIPYHRVFRVEHDGQTIFERKKG